MAENKHDKKQNRIIAGSLKNVGAVFDDTAWKAIHIATNSGYNPQSGEPFSFSRMDTRKKAEKMLKQFVSRLQGVVLTGNNVSWSNANDKNDALIATLANGKKIPKELLMQWQHHNLHALTEFNTRTENGMNLSDRIWEVGKQYRSELELALSLGIGEGKSADVLSRDVRQYLQHPNMLFRRVRDADHNLQLSKPAQAYHPGRGVYRSSYKNALRLTATENNMAYRTADYTRWQQMNFILGIQIKTSPNNHPKTDICDTLQGRYPKEFKFRGWHPWCRCIAVPILPNEKAFFKGLEGDLKGEYCPYGNQVLTMPRRFNEWVSTNTQRMSEAKTIPYWIKDNFAKGNMEKGLQFVTVSEEQYSSLKQIAKEVGVKIGVPMSHEMADTSHPNPHFAEDMGCRINCQSVVMAYTLRRMGLPVEAYSNNGSTCMGAYVMKNTRAAWASEDGTLPEQIISKRAVKDRTIDKRGYVKRIYTTPSDVLADFEEKTITPGQYHVKWKWQGTNVGHIINMEVFPDGSRKYSCSQGDRAIEGKNLLPWLKGKKGNIRIDLDNGLMAYRVDNLKPNATIVRGLVKKVGSKIVTPSIDDKQIKLLKRINAAENVTISTKLEPLKIEDYSYKSPNKGEIIIHHSRIDNANINKQERKKFLKEYQMCKILTDYGYKINMLQEKAGISSCDITIDGINANLKSLSSKNNIARHVKDAIKKQQAKIVIIELEKKSDEIMKELQKLKDKGVDIVYYFKDDNKLNYLQENSLIKR